MIIVLCFLSIKSIHKDRASEVLSLSKGRADVMGENDDLAFGGVSFFVHVISKHGLIDWSVGPGLPGR